MATMVRVKMDAPTSGATVSAGAVTLGVVLTDELAIMVGDTVARQRLGSETKEILKLLAQKPRDLVVVAAGNVRTFLGVAGMPAHELEAAAATELNAVVPTETEVGLVVGATAATLLNRTDIVLAAVKRALDAFVASFGV